MASFGSTGGDGFKPLVRGMTFDTRRRDQEGFAPLARAKTFAGSSKSSSNLYYAHPASSRFRGASFDQPKKQLDKIVVLTDTFSTGLLIASMLYAQGYRIVRVLSANLGALLDFAPDGATCEFLATLSIDESNPDWSAEVDGIISKLRDLPYPVSAIIAGAETGVELADALSERMGMPLSNGTALTEARRNKYVMGETIRAAGVRAVKQLQSSSWDEIHAFIAEWNPSPFKVIVKPLDSAGSDDVTLCVSLAEVEAATRHIIGKVNGLGLVNAAVLVQEFLEGDEYVVDSVSLNGHHKIVAIWLYDRRPVNGAHFVCFGQRLLLASDPYCEALCAYQKKVLDALGIKNGPTHGEVKICRGEPVLVEAGARCHGGDGFWTTVADEVYGYNQATATIDAHLHPDEFHKIPDTPTQRKAYGALKWFIFRREGRLRCFTPAVVDEIKSFESYRGHQFFKEAGELCKPTMTCFTWAGALKLANASSDALEADYLRSEELEASTLVQLED